MNQDQGSITVFNNGEVAFGDVDDPRSIWYEYEDEGSDDEA